METLRRTGLVCTVIVIAMVAAEVAGGHRDEFAQSQGERRQFCFIMCVLFQFSCCLLFTCLTNSWITEHNKSHNFTQFLWYSKTSQVSESTNKTSGVIQVQATKTTNPAETSLQYPAQVGHNDQPGPMAPIYPHIAGVFLFKQLLRSFA